MGINQAAKKKATIIYIMAIAYIINIVNISLNDSNAIKMKTKNEFSILKRLIGEFYN